MILKAFDSGAPEERMANTLGVDVAAVRKKRDLLDGICGEATELLKKRPIWPCAIRELRHMKAMRQIEMVEIMIATRNFTVAYAKCLVAATPQGQLVHPESPKEIAGTLTGARCWTWSWRSGTCADSSGADRWSGTSAASTLTSSRSSSESWRTRTSGTRPRRRPADGPGRAAAPRSGGS